MTFLRARFQSSPEYPRVAPFAIFVVLTVMQGWFGEDSKYWFYVVKTLVGAWLVWEMRPFVQEMRWAISWEAVVVGVAVCVMWVGIDDLYPKFSKPGPVWNPFPRFSPGLAWTFVVVHLLGST